MTIEICIWNSRGQLRTDYTDEELNSLDSEKRDRFDRLRAAATDLEQAEADLLAAQQSVERWVKTRADGIAELNRLRPPLTAHQNWMAAFRPDLLK